MFGACTHLNKSGGVKALYRATGSLAFTAAARGAWLVAKDQHNPRRRLWLPVKSFLAPGPTGMAYTLQPCSDNPEVACVAWDPDPIQVSADDALAALQPDWSADACKVIAQFTDPALRSELTDRYEETAATLEYEQGNSHQTTANSPTSWPQGRFTRTVG